MTSVSNQNDNDSQPVIELSSVYFYAGAAPRSIALRDCGLPTDRPVPGALSALYGYQSKQEGFMAARAYADRERLQFTVIDFLVGLDHKQNPLMMKPEDLAHHDFIAFQRLSRSMMDNLQEILKKRLTVEGIEPSQAELSKPQLLIMQRPDLITSVLQETGWEHLKVIAYPAKLAISDKPLNVGTVPFTHWGAIQEATCRLNPNIRVTLDPPPGYGNSTPPTAPSPAIKNRDPRPRVR